MTGLAEDELRFLTVAAIFCLIAVIVRELVIKNPVVNLRLYRERNFSLANGLIFCLGFVLAGSTVLLPQFLQTLMGYSAMRAGMVLSPAGWCLSLPCPRPDFFGADRRHWPMIIFGLPSCSAARCG